METAIFDYVKEIVFAITSMDFYLRGIMKETICWIQNNSRFILHFEK